MTNGEILDQLFSDRNALVHEIRITDIGHRNIRDFTSFEDALTTGGRLMKLIMKIEAQITNHAPDEFPNLLDIHGDPVNEEDNLRKRVDELETEIEAAIKTGNTLDELTVSEWQDMRARWNKFANAELEFIETLAIPGFQYYDVRPFLRSNLIGQRLLYLGLLTKQIIG